MLSKKILNCNLRKVIKVNKMNSDNYLKQFIENKNPLEDKDIIHNLSVATTHLIYRNGPVEDMHADGKLTDYAMMKINKFMVNRLGGIFLILLDDQKISIIKNISEDHIDILTYVVIEYCFLDGIENSVIDIERLEDEDIDIILDFMDKKLYIILSIILEKDIQRIKSILANNLFYGTDWDYCIPDIIDFNLFLKKLDQQLY